MAAATRAPLLTNHGLYRDDAWPALATRTGLGRALRLGVTAPGFELWLRTWLGTGWSTTRAQLPGLVVSVAAAVGLYLLARRIGCSPAAALVGGGILALSPVSVLYATRVKQYPFEALLAVAILAVSVEVLARPPTPVRWAALLAVVGASAAFSAPLLGVGAVAVLSVAWAGWRRGGADRRRALLCGAGFALAVAAYSALVLGAVPPSLHRLWGDNYVDASGPVSLVRTTYRVLDQFMAGAVYRHGPTGVLLLGAITVGALAFRPRLAVLALGPVALAVVLAALRRVPLGGGRIDEYLYPGLALAAAMAAQAVLALPQLRRVPPLVAGAPLVAGLVVFALTAGRAHVEANPYPGVDMAELRTLVHRRQAPGDGIVVSPFSRYPWALVSPVPPSIALNRHFATGFSVASTDPDEMLMPAEYVEDGYDPSVVARFARGRSRLWYVATDSPASDTPPAVQAHEQDAERVLVAAGWRVTERVDVFGGHADLLVAPPSPAAP